MEHAIDYHTNNLAIIVVNFASSHLLAENLVAVASGVPEAQVVVVDNFSSAAEASTVTRLAREHGWSTVLLATNEGFGGGMNAGVARAIESGAARFLLINPDATIDAASVLTLLERVEAAPMTLVSPVVRRPDGSPWFAGADLYLDDGRVRSRRRRDDARSNEIMPWLSGACLAVSDVLWSAVGGFDDRYFLYWEDIDLSWKVLNAGGKLEVVTEATAVHSEGGTQERAGRAGSGNQKSDTYYFYNIRNRLLFASLRLSDTRVRAWRNNARRVGWEILMQGGRRQFLNGLSPLFAGIRGHKAASAIASEFLRTTNESESR